MISSKIVTLLVLLLVAEAIHLRGNHEASVDLPAGTVNLIADNGQAIKVCNNCGAAAYTDSASVADYSASNNDEVWTLEVVGSQVAFKGSNGKYLSRCNNCWNSAAYPDAAFVHTPDYQSWSLWTPVLNGNGKYSFRSDNGKYLAKCNNCAYQGNTPNFAFVHEANPDNSWAQWDVTYTNLPKLGTYTFQAENGQFLKLCSSCGGSYPSAASVQSGSGADFQWNLSRIGTKLAIKGSNGNFLSRCNNCWNGGAYPDSVFVHLNTANEPYSQWTPTRQADGNWAFQADTGKYLARCNNCASSSSPNLAFVHATNPGAETWAQWTLTSA